MGNKKFRTKYLSKGQRPNVAASTLKLVASGVTEIEKALNKLRAWRKGRNPKIVVDSGARGSNKRYTSVPANKLWGDPRGRVQKDSGDKADD